MAGEQGRPVVELVPLSNLSATKDNPRRFADDQAFKDLVASVKAMGVLQPILVRPIAISSTVSRLEIRAGERRWRAAKAAGLTEIPAVIREMDDKTAMEVTVTENLHREDLRPLEEAAGVAGLLRAGFKREEIADKLGKPLTWVLRRARLADLSPSWRKEAENPKSGVSRWPAGHLELIARFPKEQQEEIREELDWMSRDEMPSLEDLAHHIADRTHTLIAALWKADDATLDPKAGSCDACMRRSSCTPGLFDDATDPVKARGQDKCLDSGCWARKMAAALVAKAAALKQEHPNLVLLTERGEAPAAFKGRTVADWNVEKAKKGEKWARPALVVSGNGVGSVRWIKLDSNAGGGSAAKGVKVPGEKASLKDREAALEKRRRAFVSLAIAKRIEHATPSDVHLTLPECARLAAAFGTEGNNGRHYGQDPNTWGTFDRMGAPESILKRLWERVRAVLVDRIRSYGDPVYSETERCAKLFGFDLDAETAKAREEIPEPKSWAAERAQARAKKGK